MDNKVPSASFIGKTDASMRNEEIRNSISLDFAVPSNSNPVGIVKIGAESPYSVLWKDIAQSTRTSFSTCTNSPQGNTIVSNTRSDSRRADCAGRLPSPLPRLRSISKSRANDSVPSIINLATTVRVNNNGKISPPPSRVSNQYQYKSLSSSQSRQLLSTQSQSQPHFQLVSPSSSDQRALTLASHLNVYDRGVGASSPRPPSSMHDSHTRTYHEPGSLITSKIQTIALSTDSFDAPPSSSSSGCSSGSNVVLFDSRETSPFKTSRKSNMPSQMPIHTIVPSVGSYQSVQPPSRHLLSSGTADSNQKQGMTYDATGFSVNSNSHMSPRASSSSSSSRGAPTESILLLEL